MVTKINQPYLNALLADAAYVDLTDLLAGEDLKGVLIILKAAQVFDQYRWSKNIIIELLKLGCKSELPQLKQVRKQVYSCTNLY